MNGHEAVIFLFTISKELKRSLDRPVILMTQKDYAEGIYNALVDMRTALLQQSDPQRVLDIVTSFHGEWLTAVNDVDIFRKRLRGTPRETVFRALAFTRVCVQNRYQAFSEYITELKSTLNEDEKSLIQVDLLTIADMEQTVLAVLTEKENILRNTVDPEEYYQRITDEVEELMNWLDCLNDNLAIAFCEVLGLKVPRLISDLTKTFEQIIEEMHNNETYKEMRSKDQTIKNLFHYKEIGGLEIKDVIKKIKILENRVAKLKNEDSSAVMALEHMIHYLKGRLQSIDDMKRSLHALKNKCDIDSNSDLGDQSNIAAFHIFNHFLPAHERAQLVEKFMLLWSDAIFGSKASPKSIISILSVTDMKEVFTDELGEYSFDKYSRKIYTIGSDGSLYQRNENNELVLLSDDYKHVYFYDNCGRYYMNDQKDRIYVARDDASEYRVNSKDLLIKVCEVRDGITYFYDQYGKFYLNSNHNRIYYDDATGSKYENNGLGNLNLLHSDLETRYKSAPLYLTGEPMVLEESIYLKEAVGEALKKCVADVVLHQPQDPVLYLAERLEAYQRRQELLRLRIEDEKEMMAERKLRMRPRLETPTTSSYDEEGTIVLDENFAYYETLELDPG